MKQQQEKIEERVEGNRIYLNGDGTFPKEVVVLEADENGQVHATATRILRKTSNGGFLLN